MRPSNDDVEAGSGCASAQSATTSAGQQRKRGLARFNLRRLLYASPLLGRRLIRGPSTIAVPRGHKSSVVSSTANTVASVTAPPSGTVGDLSCDSGHPISNGIDVPTASTTTIIPNRNTSSECEKGQTSTTQECPLCLVELPKECFPEVATCTHRSCFDCFQQYLKIEISESRVGISCPECNESLHPNDIRMILNNPQQYEKYEDFMVRRVLAIEPDSRWCPAPDCSYAVIATGCASCPKLKCERPGCNAYFCYHCKAEWHPNQTCDSARAQRSPNVRSSSISFSQDSHHRDDIKPCPRCQVYIVKMDDGSCNHMTCAVCGAEFCWLCMKEISDLHYLSPSGCTFWGKKPWSRKKKLLWQLGTLVGAPVGIGLLAGIAIPAMIIGIPVWVGRKIYARYEHSNKHKRNFAIAGGVTASVIISPVLAGLAVAIGVPILLFYVYGVVPVSLCRSGGCGVSTSATGVRFEFDDETDLLGVLSPRTTDAASIDAVSHRGANPSIGEASLSLGSGSHLERLGRDLDRDRESASNHALTGSIASNGQPGVQRLEVQADVASSHRLSMSSETASAASLSERSNTDDGMASIRALAGSVVNLRVVAAQAATNPSSTCSSAINNSGSNSLTMSATPVEVHADANSLSSLEDVTTVPMRRSRKRKPANEIQNWGWQISSESELISERVRFDDHVSFLGPSITCEPFTSTESSTPDFSIPGPASSLLVTSSESKNAFSSLRTLFPEAKRLQKVRKPQINNASSTESGSAFTTEGDLKNSILTINSESCPESKSGIASSDVKAK